MAKKIRKKSLLIVVMILIILIFLTNGIIKIFHDIEQKHNNEEKGFSSEDTEKPIESKSITISFAGDVTMGNYKGSPYDSTFDQEFKKQDGNYDYFFENVRGIFSEDDLTVVNLEGPLTTALEAKVKQFAFKGDPSYVNILKSGDIEAVTLANNHSEDYFEEGIEETKFILKENNINYFGLGEKSVVDSNGVKVGLLGYNGWPENYNQENLDSMNNDIESLKNISNKSLPVKTFDYDGVRYKRKTAIDLSRKLEKELDDLNAQISKNDMYIYEYFTKAEHEQNKPKELEDLYREFLEFDSNFNTRYDIYFKLLNELQFVSTTTPYEQISSNFNNLKPTEEMLKSEIKKLLSDPILQADITKEIKKNLELYVSEELEYFGVTTYYDDNLNTLYSAMHNYAYLLSRRYFLMKKNILTYQEELT